MVRRAIESDLRITLDQNSRLTLSRQIYEEIRGLILEGKLAPGRTVPSSRTLCKDLGVARATVIEALEQLKAEGYLETKNGSGTTVSRELPATVELIAPRETVSHRIAERHPALSSFANRLLKSGSLHPHKQDVEISFYPWRTSTLHSPVRQLSQVFTKLAKMHEKDLLAYPDDERGLPTLRDAIAKTLARPRGIRCSADNIIIVAGLTQALQLISRIHLERGDLVAMEEPGYPPVRKQFEMEGATVHAVPVDENGIQAEKITQSAERFRLLYLTPTHQFPTGAALSLPRRLQLLTWAKQTGALLIEDEHDSEFHHVEKPVPPLKALDSGNSVIFVGTFAKTVFPSLAVAYMVLPYQLVDAYALARQASSDQIPTFLQAALAEYLREGSLKRHVKRMQQVYSERRDALLRSLETHFGAKATVRGSRSGLHVLLKLQTDRASAEIIERAAQIGVGVISTAEYYSGAPADNEYILGYADLEISQIEEGIKRLASVTS